MGAGAGGQCGGLPNPPSAPKTQCTEEPASFDPVLTGHGAEARGGGRTPEARLVGGLKQRKQTVGSLSRGPAPGDEMKLTAGDGGL